MVRLEDYILQKKHDRNIKQLSGERRTQHFPAVVLTVAVNRRQIAFFSHSLLHNKFLKWIFEGNVLGKKSRKRLKIKILEHAQQIIKWQNYYEMKRAAEKREQWLHWQSIDDDDEKIDHYFKKVRECKRIDYQNLKKNG